MFIVKSIHNIHSFQQNIKKNYSFSSIYVLVYIYYTLHENQNSVCHIYIRYLIRIYRTNKKKYLLPDYKKK